MFRRRSSDKESNTLWDKYPDYEPIHNLNDKPLFDETLVTEQHAVLGQIIRENWDRVHPLAKDYMLSCASEWRRLLVSSVQLKNSSQEKEGTLQEKSDQFEKEKEKLLIEKEAEIERIKQELTSKYQKLLDEKDEELEQYKMLSDSVKSSLDDTQHSKSNLETIIDEKDNQIKELEKRIMAYQDRINELEDESKRVQESISKNFQEQISNLSNNFHEKREENEKMKDVLRRAKDQLITLKDQNQLLVKENKKLENRIDVLEQMV
ncbi:MAG: hypothetical protein U9O98_02215, partial [Asgard group archaeon]|nr:hypothetical protein [Asgard group archaeon]